MKLLKKVFFIINKKIMHNSRLALVIMYVLPSFKRLFGKTYNKIVKEETFTNGINKKKLFQIANTVKLTTPYYKKKNLPKTKTLKDFESLFVPLNKNVLLHNLNDLVSTDFSKSNYDSMTTGGTSGSPTQFFVPKNRYKKEFAFFHKVWSKLGYNEHIRGVIRNEKLSHNKTYKINSITKEIIFDGFRNNNKYYQKIYETLLKLKIQYLQGYPSSVYNFFLFLKEENKDVSFIKGVFLSSEIFLNHQRSFLVDNMQLPIISVYGHSEKLIMAVDFKGNNQYEVIENYGYLELVDENNKVIKEEDILGEIVGTTFNNYGMPLVRYKTGDFSSYIKYSETEPRILKGIQGRWQEMKIYNKDGSFITPTALNLHDELNKCINGLQYVQKEKGKLEIHIIPNINFTKKIETVFYKHFRDRMSEDSTIEIIKVKALQKRKNGKFLLLESSIA